MDTAKSGKSGKEISCRGCCGVGRGSPYYNDVGKIASGETKLDGIAQLLTKARHLTKPISYFVHEQSSNSHTWI